MKKYKCINIDRARARDNAMLHRVTKENKKKMKIFYAQNKHQHQHPREIGWQKKRSIK